MTSQEAHARVKARIWQAIAQNNLTIPELPKEKMEALVSVATEAALLELDGYLERTVEPTLAAAKQATAPKAKTNDEGIQDIDIRQAFRERLLNVADILIAGHDSTHPKTILNNIKDPEAVHELLRKAILKARKKHGLVYREVM